MTGLVAPAAAGCGPALHLHVAVAGCSGCHRWIPRVDLVSVAARQKLPEPFYRLLGSMRGDVGMGPLGFMRALIRFVVTCTFVWRRDLGEDEPS